MPPSQRKNVLIVEDDSDIRECVYEILTLEGYSVTQACNGKEGLDRLTQMERPCIILLDMMMPVMDGGAFLSQLEAEPVLRGCRVLLLTASLMQPPPSVVGMLRKPFTIPELLELVNRHCP